MKRLCVPVERNKPTVKALIEPPELILRGEIRRKVAFTKMKNVRANGGWLQFMFEGESVALQLGDGMAAKWVEALRSLLLRWQRNLVSRRK